MDLNIENPWHSTEGRRARQHTFAALAEGNGPIADFAADVTSGHRQPADLLSYPPAAEDIHKRLSACGKLLAKLSTAERARIAPHAPAVLREMISTAAG
ncbi:hypothetical protein EV191_1035 [Tamaricihabitans halophyticus]|uniref:Uncharacterized protein n=1 Tax=Tamaricihabitans halophyticus TaxID=1262583 RepID=A0A4R2R3K9_9PSEU|nr:hypothetical protein [Tamaricihabitans halophyticus]TCP53965.1 hypothetical protein EV191_1035 [Tamaricihabitans halophyticus]